MDLFHTDARGYLFPQKKSAHEMTATPKGYTGCFKIPLTTENFKRRNGYCLHESAVFTGTKLPAH